MSDPLGPRPPGGFHDLVPWADPYIAALVEKLRRSEQLEETALHDISDELPPPLDNGEVEPESPRLPDWSRRNWRRD